MLDHHIHSDNAQCPVPIPWKPTVGMYSNIKNITSLQTACVVSSMCPEDEAIQFNSELQQ